MWGWVVGEDVRGFDYLSGVGLWVVGVGLGGFGVLGGLYNVDILEFELEFEVGVVECR